MSTARIVRIVGAVAFAASAFTALAAPATVTSQLDAGESRVLVEVGKAGAFSFVAGHPHVIEGPIQGTLSVDLAEPERAVAAFEIRTADLMVRDEGEPAGDVRKVQQTMDGPEVLNVSRYPTVRFRSTSVELEHRSSTHLKLTVIGNLTLHGITQSIAVPVDAELTGDAITSRGRFAVKQTDYGMTPVSVAGGMVSVKDALVVHFTVVSPLGPTR